MCSIGPVFASPMIDEAEQRVVRALDFVARNLGAIRDAAPEESRADKAAAEIALVCALLERESVPEAIRERVRGIAESIEPRVRGAGWIRELLWAPARIATLAMGHVLLARAGRPAPAVDAFVRSLWGRGFDASLELSPFQVLERQWSAELCEVDVEAPPIVPLPTCDVHPLHMHENDAYAFTHAIFYDTDFGARPLPDRYDRDRVVATIDAAVSWCLCRVDFDLLAEFLLCGLFVAEHSTPAMRLGAAAVFAAWDDLGLVPDRAVARAQDEDDPHRMFFALYHANLVAIVLQVVADRREPTWWTDARAVSLRAPLPKGYGATLRAWPSGSPGVAASVSAPAVLAMLRTLLGESVAGGLAAQLDERVLEHVGADLLLHYAMHERDLELVLDGLACTRTPSWTSCAVLEWLLVFRRGLTTLGFSDASAAAQLDARIVASIDRCVTDLRAAGLLDDQSGSSTP